MATVIMLGNNNNRRNVKLWWGLRLKVHPVHHGVKPGLLLICNVFLE